jgi:hypothetical protein
MEGTEKRIGIRPTTSVYATYQRLSYKPWYAIAEFVDNSTQSYYANKNLLKQMYKNPNSLEKKLTIHINYDNTTNTLTIYDNAYGMEFDDFKRALILDSPPIDKSGRSEFGMGLKTAACWFGTHWTVETTQLGSDRLLLATIDVNELAKYQEDSVIYTEKTIDKNEHYTRITIRDLQHPVQGRTVTKVQEHLSSIYREDLRSGEASIFWNGVPLKFEDPEIYQETDEENNTIVWKRNIDFIVPWKRKGTDLSVKGWIGIRKEGKQRDAGFTLMRRGRVIIGGPGENYKPVEVFKQGNSFQSQRLIGELYLDDWPVTQAKDGFDWSDGLEDALIDMLQVEAKEYADKSENIRANRNSVPQPITKPKMEKASKDAKEVFQDDHFSKWIAKEIENKKKTQVNNDKSTKVNNTEEKAQKKEELENGPILYELNIEKKRWLFKLFWLNEHTQPYWMSLDQESETEIKIFLNVAHPFFAEYINDDGILELIQKLVITISLAEKMAILSTTNENLFIEASDIRTFMNKILTKISMIRKVEN